MHSPKSRDRQPPETRDHVPEPRIILFGCRPFVPYHGYRADANGNDPPFHAPFAPVVIGGGHWPRDRCPTCRGRIDTADRETACGWCHAVSPANEARCRAQALGAKGREVAAQGRLKCQAEADAMGGGVLGGGSHDPRTPVLSERQRRHLEQKYGNEGRAWLRAIDQMPDYSLVLDHRGRGVRIEAEELAEVAV